MGLTNYGNREIAAVQTDVEQRSVVFWELYILQILTGVIVILIYVLYAGFFAANKVAAMIMLMCVISAAFDINWFFMGMELFRLTVTRNAIIKILTAISIFIFVKEKNDGYVYIWIMSLGTLLSQLCLWTFIKKYVTWRKPTIKGIIRHILPNLKMFIPVISVSIYKIMDKIMLGAMSTMAQVGYYENAEKIINIAVAPITAIGVVMLPRITANISKNSDENLYIDKSMMLVLLYSNAAAFGIYAVGKMFAIVFFGELFKQSGVLMQFLSVTIIFLGAGNVIRTQYLIPKKMDNIYIKSAMYGAITKDRKSVV